MEQESEHSHRIFCCSMSLILILSSTITYENVKHDSKLTIQLKLIISYTFVCDARVVAKIQHRIYR